MRFLAKAAAAASLTLAGSTTCTLAAPASAAYSTTLPEGDLAQAIVRIGTGPAICSGSMISPHWVITARHCVADARVGTNFTTVGEITIGDKPSNSRKYTGKTYLHPETDLALININGTYTGPTLSIIDHHVDTDTVLYGAGFGSSPKQATAYTVSNNHYSTAGGSDVLRAGHRVRHEPTGSDTAIMGDSGSPLITPEGEIVSVMARGGSYSPVKDIATTPMDYLNNVDVSKYRTWIMDTAGLEDTGAADSGPSDARYGQFVDEVARLASSKSPEDLGVKDALSSNVPIGVAALFSLILGVLTAGAITMARR